MFASARPYRHGVRIGLVFLGLIGCGPNTPDTTPSEQSQLDALLDQRRKEKAKEREAVLKQAVEAQEKAKQVSLMTKEIEQTHPDIVQEIVRFSGSLAQDNNLAGGNLSTDTTYFADLIAFAWNDPEAFVRAKGPEYEQYIKDNEDLSLRERQRYHFVYWFNAKGYFGKIKANDYQRLAE